MSGESVEQSVRLVGGRYELEALIGKGGVGEVWRARHVALNSRVAIKFLQPASAQKESAKRRFIVHRDFKPDNIVIYEDDEGRDQVKVLDFGVAKLVGALEDQGEGDSDAKIGQAPSFTRTGAVLGTPLYMAPEQIRDATSVDPRVDIWAFGVVAFECLTGRPPFTGSTLLELFDRIQGCQHASATFVEPSVPAGFDAWFDVACAPDPAKRFPNVTIAWKQLTVALDIPGNDSSPSLGGFDPNAASGERRVLIVADAKEAEAKADTLDSSRNAPAEIRSRTHTGGFASLQRISLDELPAVAPSRG